MVQKCQSQISPNVWYAGPPSCLSGSDHPRRLELRGLHEDHVHGPRRERAEGPDEQAGHEADGGALADGRLHPPRPHPGAVLENPASFVAVQNPH